MRTPTLGMALLPLIGEDCELRLANNNHEEEITLCNLKFVRAADSRLSSTLRATHTAPVVTSVRNSIARFIINDLSKT